MLQIFIISGRLFGKWVEPPLSFGLMEGVFGEEALLIEVASRGRGNCSEGSFDLNMRRQRDALTLETVGKLLPPSQLHLAQFGLSSGIGLLALELKYLDIIFVLVEIRLVRTSSRLSSCAVILNLSHHESIAFGFGAFNGDHWVRRQFANSLAADLKLLQLINAHPLFSLARILKI